MTFSEKLKQAMQELHLNQRQVCGMTGKSKGSVSQYLSGKQIPSEDVQSAIAVALGLESDYFSKSDEQVVVLPTAELKNGVIPRLDVEKAANPTYETTGGYLKVLNESECGQLWWGSLSDFQKNYIKSIPNFDAEIFEQCTGIKVDE